MNIGEKRKKIEAVLERLNPNYFNPKYKNKKLAFRTLRKLTGENLPDKYEVWVKWWNENKVKFGV